MKNKKILTPLIVFLFVASFTVEAQKGEGRLNINYNVAFPTGNFKNIISDNSYRGFNATLLFGVSNNLSVGLGTGFQDFYQKNPRQLYKLSDGSDLSAVTTYSIQTIPLLAEFKYNFAPDMSIQPYVAAGVGGNFIQYNHLYGEFGDQQSKFKFAARPEAGLNFPFKKNGAGFTIGASYNIMPLKQDEFDNVNNIGVHAGVSIPLGR